MAEEVRTQKTKKADYITLNEGDSSYHFLFDENPSVSFIINYERMIQDVNKKCCETLGFKKTDIVGKDPLDFIHPLSRVRISNVIDQLFNKEIVTDIETDIITNGGGVKKILFAPGRLIEYNKSFAVLLSGVDITEAKKTLHEFEKSNELFTRFMNLLSAGVFIRNEHNVCVFRNKFITDSFDPEAVNKLAPDEDVSGLSISRFLDLKDKTSKSRYCEVTTFRINHKDFKGYTGGIIIDLTDRIEAERSQKESETVFKTIFDNSSMGILLSDLDGRIMECNPSFLRITGYTAAELKNLLVKDISHAADYENENAVFKRALEVNQRNAVQLQKRFITKENNVIWTNLTLNIVRDDLGAPRFFMQLIEDITERKIIKETLERFEFRNKAIVSALPDLIFIIREDGVYLDYSMGTTRDLAIEESRLIGSNIKDLFTPDTASYILEKIKKCIKTGSQDTIEYELLISGGKKYFEARIVRYDDQSILGVVRNITAEKQKEEQLKKYSEEMAELNASKNRLFSIIAHDLRSPFHALLGISEILANESADLSKEEMMKFGVELHSALKLEYNLLENLLAWSKIQRDSIEINPVQLNLHNAVEETVKLLSWLAKNKKISIANLVAKNVSVRFDVNLLGSVLQNIISNSLKFSPEGSTVRIEHSVNKGVNSVEITDEGPGLSDEEIDRILHLRESDIKPDAAGRQSSGLGLIICREFVEKHRGNLHINSIKGKGTTVGFTFP